MSSSARTRGSGRDPRTSMKTTTAATASGGTTSAGRTARTRHSFAVPAARPRLYANACATHAGRWYPGPRGPEEPAGGRDAMRASVLLAVAVVLVASVSFAVARAAPEDEGITAERIESLERRVRLLNDEVGYLLAREEALTRAAVAADPLARNVMTGIDASRREGFESGAFPAGARATLLRTFEVLARDLAA